MKLVSKYMYWCQKASVILGIGMGRKCEYRYQLVDVPTKPLFFSSMLIRITTHSIVKLGDSLPKFRFDREKTFFAAVRWPWDGCALTLVPTKMRRVASSLRVGHRRHDGIKLPCILREKSLHYMMDDQRALYLL